MLAAERMAVTGATDSAARPDCLLAFVAGQGMRWAVGATALRAGLEAGWAKTPGAAWCSAALKVDSAVVAAALRIGAARCAVGTSNLATGAAAYLIFGASGFFAAGAAHHAIDADGGLVNMAGQGMRWATGASTGSAGACAGDTHGALGDRAAQLMILAGMVSTIFCLRQTIVADPGAIDRAGSKWMFGAAAPSATRA